MHRNRVVEGARVLSLDGRDVGRVVSRSRDHFEIVQGYFFPKLHLIAYEHIQKIENDVLRLSLPFEALKKLWNAQEDYEEPGEQRRARQAAQELMEQEDGSTHR